MRDHPDAFETEGTIQWFCAKTRAPHLSPPWLCYRTRIRKLDGDRFMVLEIVDPTYKRSWTGRYKHKVLVAMQRRLNEDSDWRDVIADLAVLADDRLHFNRSIEDAKAGRNPYVGTFFFMADDGYDGPRESR